MKIAIQGAYTSFHAAAAKRLFGKADLLVPCDTFTQVFAALDTKQADVAIVAIENSLYGSINEVYDLLLQHEYHIVGEVYEHIQLQLLGIQGASLDTITDIYSQAPALAEAQQFLDTQLPHAERHEYYDTAAAAGAVSEWNDPTKAAIASQAAATHFGLQILAPHIETHPDNYTRFIAISAQKTLLKQPATKTSLTFRTEDVPGSLYGALGVFANRTINLSKLESRPIVGKAWHYMYYVDFLASLDQPEVTAALADLKNYTSEIRVLGSYPAGAVENV